MHFEDPYQAPSSALEDNSRPWYKDLTRYHWFVLIVAALGWMFDTMDQQLFNLARKPAVTEMLKGASTELPSPARWPSTAAMRR